MAAPSMRCGGAGAACRQAVALAAPATLPRTSWIRPRVPATLARVRYRLLAAIPFVGALVVLLVAALQPDDQRWNTIDDLTRAAKVAALFGCLVAGLSFQRGEYLRRGWLLNAATYGILALRDGVLHRDLVLDHGLPLAHWLDAAMVTVANVAAVIGTWIMARAWRVSGVDLPGNRAWRRIAQVGMVFVAVAVTMPSLAIDMPHLLDGSPNNLAGVVGSFSDAICLALVVPVVMTAIGLRGTRIVWPWALLALSIFGWLLYDATFTVSQVVGIAGRPLRAVGDAARVLAACASFSAGVVQRLIATSEPRPRAAALPDSARARKEPRPAP
jgi:hypothetical protein